MSAGGYVNREQFTVPGKPMMVSTTRLMAMPSADAPGETVADLAVAKRAQHGHEEHVEKIRLQGVEKPVLIGPSGFIDGHHRVIAAHDAGVQRVPVERLR